MHYRSLTLALATASLLLIAACESAGEALQAKPASAESKAQQSERSESPAPAFAGSGSALAQAAPIDAYLWALVELNGDPLADAKDAGAQIGPHLIFLEDSGRIVGSTGCNRLTGEYERSDDGGFRLGEIATTKMACPDMELEAAFLEALRAYERSKIGASRIRLLNDAGEVIAIFEARALPEGVQ